MVDTQKVGAFIAQCRKEHNWTQKELGEKLGVTDKAVSKWENGRSFPDITLLESLCETFDITVSELLSGKKIESEDYKSTASGCGRKAENGRSAGWNHQRGKNHRHQLWRSIKDLENRGVIHVVYGTLPKVPSR